MKQRSGKNSKDISNILSAYEDKWVALSPDGKRVNASAKSLEQLEKKLRKLGDKDSIYTRVLPFDQTFAP
ncbi:MAG TPA: hypothetical protein VMW25_03570 [Clostridia bacterium]|nr:hypothetical protein [Clostridia bacterium]